MRGMYLNGTDMRETIEKSETDMLLVYGAGHFSQTEGGALSGILSYGDSNGIVLEMGRKMTKKKANIPAVAGVCGTDPFRIMENFLKDLKKSGYEGVHNYPTVGLIDGNFRMILEERGISYKLEVDMIRKAHELDLFTCAYVFTPEEAVAMAEAGADCLIAHMGLSIKRDLNIDEKKRLDYYSKLSEKIIRAGRLVNSDIMILIHGGGYISGEDIAEAVKKEMPEVREAIGAFCVEYQNNKEENEKFT